MGIEKEAEERKFQPSQEAKDCKNFFYVVLFHHLFHQGDDEIDLVLLIA